MSAAPHDLRADLRAAAQAYRQAGLSVLPARLAEKRPALASWKPYQERLPTVNEVDDWFSQPQEALCIITGVVSGGLEMIDFDQRAEMFAPWATRIREAAPGLLERLLIERSQSGGRHVVYRCASEICGNLKLAQRSIATPDGQPITIHGKTYVPQRRAAGYEVIVTCIETRGEGGLFLCHPSPGYQLEQGAFEHLPVLTVHEREMLLKAAWSLNELEEQIEPSISALADGRPGDDFNRRGDVRDVLRRNGWQLVRGGENEYWRRPGKDRGWSATLKHGTLYVFSSNAVPFEASRGYSPFAVLAALEHGGDFNAAARWLQQQGYGEAVNERPGVDLSAFMPPLTDESAPVAQPPTIAELIARYPKLRRPVIHGLIRVGESMNVIAPPKAGKSWLVTTLALACATGRPWLSTFPTEPCDVLILDNELHPETTAQRIPKVAEALGIPLREYGQRIGVQNLRGQLRDVFSLAAFFQSLQSGRYGIIILDAFYRFMPRDMDENDNGTMANIYNVIDRYADHLEACFVLIHHSTKGNQSAKTITDVGAGAGSQSRAADCHAVLRPHEEPSAAVFEAAVRSWPPVTPFALRWEYPLWTPAPDLDPAMLKSEKPKRPKPSAEDSPETPTWNVERFVETFLSDQPVTKAQLRAAAQDELGLSWRRVADLLDLAESQGLVHRWLVGKAHRVLYATIPQPSDQEEYS